MLPRGVCEWRNGGAEPVGCGARVRLRVDGARCRHWFGLSIFYIQRETGEERRHQAPGSRACIHALTRQRLDDAYVTDTARVLAADSLLTFLGLRLLPNIVYRAGSYTFV